MIALFLVVFAIAITTMLISFFVMDGDLKESASTFKKTRPIFLLAIAIAAWITSIALFTTPAYTTILTPNYNVTTTNMGNSIVSYSYYYLQPTNSMFNANDFFYNLGTTNYNSLTTIHTVLPADNGQFKIAQFITNASAFSQNRITPGLYQVHIHASSNESSTIWLYSQIWLITPNDNNLFMIGQTSLSHTLSLTDSEYISNFYNNYTIGINSTDRLAIFIFANQTTFGSPGNVILYIGALSNPHLSVPTTYTSIPAHNSTQIGNNPISVYAGYEYGAFASAMGIICVILLVIYMLRFGLTEFKDSFDELSASITKDKKK